MNLNQRINDAAQYIKARITAAPSIGLILGSGLGDFADSLENRFVIPFAEIPNFPVPTAPGHVGAMVFGKKQGKEVVVLQGRIHFYEGLSQQQITLPIRVLAAMGIKLLVLTNAAGGVNLSFGPGTLMMISDHINYSGANPLVGPNLDDFGPRFPDVSDLYTKALRDAVKDAAKQAGIEVREGVYMMFSGPNYETPAEVRMAKIVGADAVGMSTVPEALVAGHCGMEVIGISCITNIAAGLSDQKLDHSEVLEIASRVHDTFQSLLDVILRTV